MITRRRFFPQLLGAIAAGLALPKVLQSAEPYPQFNAERYVPLELEQGSGCAYIEDGAYEARPVWPWPVVADINRELAPQRMRLSLRKSEDQNAIFGRVQDLTHRRSATFWIRLARLSETPNHDHAARRRLLERSIRFQATKCAESVAFTRRTGYVVDMVDRPAHRLNRRLFYRHETTGAVRWSHP